MSHPDFPTSRPGEPRRLSPTDVSQFVRLEQCERYLRLRLHERAYGQRFLRDYGVAAEAIPPLLTRSGGRFEDEIEATLERRYRCRRFSDANRSADDDRELLLAELAALEPGAACVLLQPRLRVEVSGWLFTGDLDLLHARRDAAGALHLLIVDMKSSTGPKVEHRLQVAFYHAMVAALLAGAGMQASSIRTAILYRGPSELDPEDELLTRHRAAAVETLGIEGGCLEMIQDPEAFLESVEDLVTGPASLAERVGAAPFSEVPFHLTYKCDGCLYQEFCLKQAAEDDDLSLIPHLTGADKAALRRQGVRTTRELAGLKVSDPADEKGVELVVAPGQEDTCRRVATTWPVGPRLDELIHRARRYRQWKGDGVRGLSYIPSKGYGTLPFSDAEHAPNLVRVYIDAQHDYLHDRIYLLGARVVAAEAGEAVRSESVVRITAGPPDTAESEAALLGEWVAAVLEAVVRLAAPDALGARRAPVHLIFFNSWEQRLLLDALSRHLGALFAAAPALYDFMTQLAAYDSPIASFLDAEIRELKNYPLLCQSLQAVAAHLRFDWNTPEAFAELFRHRLFDERRKLDSNSGEAEWYTGRSRFNSQVPLEYAYAAWGELDELPRGESRHYAASTTELLLRFQARRLEAMEHIAREFRGNHLTEKRAFDLPDLAEFQDRARTLAGALEEFVAIERHVELHAWKMARHAPPERRALTGETLLARYVEADQEPYVAEQNRENARRYALRKLYEAQYRLDHPDAARIQLSKEQREETKWTPEGLRVRLRLEAGGLECTLPEALAITELRDGENVVVNPRWTADERLPEAERTLFTPTPKQMLYAPRAGIVRLPRLDEARDGERPLFVEVVLRESRGGPWSRGFVFPSFDRPLTEGELYSLDGCPNNFYGYWCAKVMEGLQSRVSGGNPDHTLYERLDGQGSSVRWGAAEEAGQQRFLDGLLALEEAGALHGFEAGKREFIGGHGVTPILLVQGPPGTGKSYSTAFALFARLQGALAADREYRVFVSCKTHAATDVLLRNVLEVREKLAALRSGQPELWSRYFDDRLLTLPLFRVAGKEESPDGIRALTKDNEKEKGEPRNADVIREQRWCVVGATPGAIYGIVKGKWTSADDLFGHPFCDCLVLDEASQMNLPEALMAALPLCADGALVVVGDHRQMPPIVQHDWENERRRTFQEYRAFRSLFETLLERGVPTIRFSESFRLHADMAEFLRREVYAGDGIPYHSQSHRLLEEKAIEDEFVRTVLRPEHPLTVVVHGERSSQKRNLFEEGLLRPLMAALADPSGYGLGPREGLGVVVPHRAQRAALQLALMETLGEAGEEVLAAVDTVERFQGGERSVILISATESDREFLLACSKFLLDPRRLNVALSRAKQKLVLVASEEIFSLFSADEETFAHSRIWKNLLRRTCTVPLWEGERDGTPVRVWGNGGAVAVTHRSG